MTLEGEHIYLRALEPTDLDFLYTVENDESVWEVSNTTTPYSKFVLKQYLDNAHRDIYEVKQLRLVICLKDSDRIIGLVDLFDFDPKHHRLGIGIIIAFREDRGKGYASDAIQAASNYCQKHLSVHQVFANITSDNKNSIQLFERLGFKPCGVKKDWIFSGGSYKNELSFQLIYE